MTGYTRRQLVRMAVATGVTGASGCLDSSGRRNGTDESTPTPTETGTNTATVVPTHGVGEAVTVGDGTTVAVTDVLATRQLLTTAADGTDVIAEPDRQYLVVSLRGDNLGTVSVRKYVRVRVGDSRIGPTSHRLSSTGGSFRLAVGLPIEFAPSDADVVWVDEESVVAAWPVEGTQLSQLGNPARFERVEFDFPAEVDPDGLPVFDGSVYNTGGPGTFRAVVTNSTNDEEEIVRMDVDAGTLAGYSGHLRIDADVGDQETVTFDWGFDETVEEFTVG